MRFLIQYITVSLSIILLLTSNCERTNILPKEDFTGLTDIIYDLEGNTYKTVGIGTQIWMTENLRSTRLNNGRILPNIKNDTNWFYTNSPGYCFYNHDSVQFNKIYGPLYNYNVVRTDSICPTGWRVPSENDWDILAEFLGGQKVAGGKLKDIYGQYWNSPNHWISNNYNFCAVPGGFRDFDPGLFYELGSTGYWWTSTNISTENWAIVMSLSNENTYLWPKSRYKSVGVSIRCIKNN